MAVTRTHLIAGVCLLSTGLVLGTLNGAIAAAEPDGPTASESNSAAGPDTSDATTSDTTTSDTTTSDTTRSDTTTSESTASDEPTSDPTTWPAAASADTTAPDTDDTDPGTVAEPAPPAAHGSGSDTAAPAWSPAPDHPPEPPALPTIEPAAPDTAAVVVHIPAPAPHPVAIPDPVEPAAAAPMPPVPAVASPLIVEAVAELVRTLVCVAVDVVGAIIRLVVDLRATLGVPWAQRGDDGGYPQSAFLPNDAVVLLLAKMLSRSASTGAGSSILGGAIAGMTLDRIMSFAATLEGTDRPRGDTRRPDRASPPPAQRVVTALAALSLWALISGALPGLGGLFVLGATGVRIGYRQARARMALHTMEFVRFARSGPVGIVRAAPTDIAPREPHLGLVA